MARAGALKNKKATVWGDKDIFDKESVIFDSKDVVIDGNIITANGPDAAQLWAKAIVNYIKNELKK